MKLYIAASYLNLGGPLPRSALLQCSTGARLSTELIFLQALLITYKGGLISPGSKAGRTVFPIPLVSFLLVILFSMIVVRIGTKALQKTGLSEDVASFQALSAFTGVGFTTSESEYVVNHPVRRNIVKWMIRLGSAGLTSAVASLVLTFVGNTPLEMATNGAGLAAGLAGLYAFSRSKLLDKLLGKFIEWASIRWTTVKIIDYEHVLGLSKGYTISIIRVKPGCWLDGKTLREARLREEGVIVLGVYRPVGRGEIYIGAPHPDFRLKAYDRIVCYGPEEVLEKLPERIRGPQGDFEHAVAVARQRIREMVEEEEIKEAEDKAVAGTEVKAELAA